LAISYPPSKVTALTHIAQTFAYSNPRRAGLLADAAERAARVIGDAEASDQQAKALALAEVACALTAGNLDEPAS
jgi:hypothetical protein